MAIKNIFIEDGGHIKEFTNIRYFSNVITWGSGNSSAFDHTNYLKGLEVAKTLLLSMIQEVKEWGLPCQNNESVIEKESSQDIIENTCRRFHRMACQLRCRHGDRPTLEIKDEFDVQDLLHALLKLNFDDVRVEESVPSHAGRNSRMDFLLKKERIVVEVKKTRNGLGAKEIGEELIIDKARYQTHPDCQILVCFVYDPEGRIGNPKGIINDLEKGNDLKIKVFIEPQQY